MAIGYLKKKASRIDTKAMQELLFSTAQQPKVNLEVVRAYMDQYDPTGEALRDEALVAKWMYGNGMLCADTFLLAVRGGKI